MKSIKRNPKKQTLDLGEWRMPASSPAELKKLADRLRNVQEDYINKQSERIVTDTRLEGFGRLINKPMSNALALTDGSIQSGSKKTLDSLERFKQLLISSNVVKNTFKLFMREASEYMTTGGVNFGAAVGLVLDAVEEVKNKFSVTVDEGFTILSILRQIMLIGVDEARLYIGDFNLPPVTDMEKEIYALIQLIQRKNESQVISILQELAGVIAGFDDFLLFLEEFVNKTKQDPEEILKVIFLNLGDDRFLDVIDSIASTDAPKDLGAKLAEAVNSSRVRDNFEGLVTNYLEKTPNFEFLEEDALRNKLTARRITLEQSGQKPTPPQETPSPPGTPTQQQPPPPDTSVKVELTDEELAQLKLDNEQFLEDNIESYGNLINAFTVPNKPGKYLKPTGTIGNGIIIDMEEALTREIFDDKTKVIKDPKTVSYNMLIFLADRTQGQIYRGRNLAKERLNVLSDEELRDLVELVEHFNLSDPDRATGKFRNMYADYDDLLAGKRGVTTPTPTPTPSPSKTSTPQPSPQPSPPKSPKTPPKKTGSPPTDDEINKKAEEIWRAKGAPQNQTKDQVDSDRIEAEKQLLAERGLPKKKEGKEEKSPPPQPKPKPKPIPESMIEIYSPPKMRSYRDLITVDEMTDAQVANYIKTGKVPQDELDIREEVLKKISIDEIDARAQSILRSTVPARDRPGYDINPLRMEAKEELIKEKRPPTKEDILNQARTDLVRTYGPIGVPANEVVRNKAKEVGVRMYTQRGFKIPPWVEQFDQPKAPRLKTKPRSVNDMISIDYLTPTQIYDYLSVGKVPDEEIDARGGVEVTEGVKIDLPVDLNTLPAIGTEKPKDLPKINKKDITNKAKKTVADSGGDYNKLSKEEKETYLGIAEEVLKSAAISNIVGDTKEERTGTGFQSPTRSTSADSFPFRGKPQAKVVGGRFGSLYIDPKSLNTLRLKVYRGANAKAPKILDSSIDNEMYDLLTKRFSPKKKYGGSNLQLFQDLMKLSEIPVTKMHSKKKDLISGKGMKFYQNYDELFDRLRLILGSWTAGNKSAELYNEASEIAEVLRKKGKIERTDQKKLMDKFA